MRLPILHWEKKDPGLQTLESDQLIGNIQVPSHSHRVIQKNIFALVLELTSLLVQLTFAYFLTSVMFGGGGVGELVMGCISGAMGCSGGRGGGMWVQTRGTWCWCAPVQPHQQRSLLAKLIDTPECTRVYVPRHWVECNCRYYLIFTQPPSFCNSPWARVK